MAMQATSNSAQAVSHITPKEDARRHVLVLITDDNARKWVINSQIRSTINTWRHQRNVSRIHQNAANKFQLAKQCLWNGLVPSKWSLFIEFKNWPRKFKIFLKMCPSSSKTKEKLIHDFGACSVKNTHAHEPTNTKAVYLSHSMRPPFLSFGKPTYQSWVRAIRVNNITKGK